MKIEPMEVNQALERGLTLSFAMVRALSRVTLGPAPETADLAELLEARFFGPEEEVRLFQGESGLQAARLTAEEGDVALENRRELSNPTFGTAVTVCSTLDFDEDGQAYVASTRLTGWEGGGC